MAGIGFRLRKNVLEGSLLDKVTAFVQGAFITCGPWLLTIIAMSCISYMHGRNESQEEIILFRSIVTYIYASSLIILGILQLPVTRYLADELYKEDASNLSPTYRAVLIVICSIYALILIPFIYFGLNTGLLLSLNTYILGQLVVCIWIAMIYLSCLHRVKSILMSFIFGTLIGTLASIQLGELWGLNGYMLGFSLGQAFIFLFLSVEIFKEYPSKRYISFSFLSYIKKYPSLLFIGLFYNLGIWIDKLLVWNSEFSISISPWMNISPIYDAPLFFAYLTVIPSYTYFMIFTETELFINIRHYYKTFMNHADLDSVIQLKYKAFDTVQNSILRLIKYQGLFTFTVLIFSSEFISFLYLELAGLAIFRIGVLAAFIHTLVLILLILLLYFEFKGLAALLCFTFFILNALFTSITLQLGVQFLGIGYLLAGIISLVTGLLSFANALNWLEYHTLKDSC